MLPGNTPALFSGQKGNDAYTKLLLHFDGPNGSTVITDSSLAAHGNGTNVGGSGISTAIAPKFGTASFGNAQNGYCTFPNSSDWEFGAGNFTVDYWSYITAAGCVIARDLPASYCPFLIGYNVGAGPVVYLTSNGTSFDIANNVTMGTNFGSVWYHSAVVRNGNTFYTFQDGVQQATWTSSLALMANSNPLCIGAAQNAMNMGGYTDELRISKGIARWTSNFTPPTAPYS